MKQLVEALEQGYASEIESAARWLALRLEQDTSAAVPNGLPAAITAIGEAEARIRERRQRRILFGDLFMFALSLVALASSSDAKFLFIGFCILLVVVNRLTLAGLSDLKGVEELLRHAVAKRRRRSSRARVEPVEAVGATTTLQKKVAERS